MLEKSSKINTVVFDKTGTLTNGYPFIVNRFHTDESVSEEVCFMLTIICESESEHPLAKAITGNLEEARNKIMTKESIRDYELLKFETKTSEGVIG